MIVSADTDRVPLVPEGSWERGRRSSESPPRLSYALRRLSASRCMERYLSAVVRCSSVI